MSFSKPAFEVADIAREFGQGLIRSHNLTVGQKKVLSSIIQCRTSELGGHKEQCNNPDCTNQRFAYNGCRNRHCPKCNGLKREKWVLDRKADALPVPYFHMEQKCTTCYSNQPGTLYSSLQLSTIIWVPK
jgi:Transposase zinc-binding domain